MDDIRDSFIDREMNLLLLIMSEDNCLSCLDMSGIYWFFTDKHTNKSGLPYPIFSNDTDTFVVSKFI